ncbi:HPP family protein [Pseudomonas sp. LS44]|uniref:HPP family protein n=1 Tax=Pseudomonas sp. LS44 TaxID=1357074 RepID=UPI00215ACA73|nr:HPP family protein [Pseudomonas sp. LS44]UVE16711.1 HPP family protein [Pseudomonas sp. LS44]
MTQRLSLANWLHSFNPPAMNTRPREWLRAGLGAALGVLLSTWVCYQLFGAPVAAHLVGPLGASAILLFAVSSGALAQPWSIVGSYLVATLVALALVQVGGASLVTASLAVGVALALMCPLRCLHPPGGAVAFCVAMGGPDLAEMGLQVLAPVMLNALCLLACALLYNNLTRVRYPKPHGTPAAEMHHTQDVAPQERVGITSADLDQALEDIGEFVDVTREDLEQIVRATEKYALRRSMGDIRAGQIMSRDVQCATPETTVEQALRVLEYHHLKALPVLDEERRLVGVVSLIDLLGHSRRAPHSDFLGRLGLRRDVPLSRVMSQPVTWVGSDAHVVELIPLLSEQGLHCLPVLEQGELVGIVTQTDLIAALHRDLIVHLG